MWLMLLHEWDSQRRAAAAATTTPKEKESMKWVRETCPSVSEYNYLDNGGAEDHWRRRRRQRRQGGAAAGRGLAAAATAVGGLAKNGGDSGNLPTTAAVALVCSRQRKLKNTQPFFSTLVDCDGKNQRRRLRRPRSPLTRWRASSSF